MPTKEDMRGRDELARQLARALDNTITITVAGSGDITIKKG